MNELQKPKDSQLSHPLPQCGRGQQSFLEALLKYIIFWHVVLLAEPLCTDLRWESIALCDESQEDKTCFERKQGRSQNMYWLRHKDAVQACWSNCSVEGAEGFVNSSEIPRSAVPCRV